MTDFETQVADVLEAMLEAEAAKRDKSSTLREWMRDELALRVAAAIEAAAAYDADSETLVDLMITPQDAALQALRGGPPAAPPPP